MWWLQDPLKERVGEVRIVHRFLLFPTCINSKYRWLEYVCIVQKVCRFDVGGSCEWGKYKHRWSNYSWSEKEEKLCN